MGLKKYILEGEVKFKVAWWLNALNGPGLEKGHVMSDLATVVILDEGIAVVIYNSSY